MKEFALIFRINDPAFRPTPEQVQERMNWLSGLASQNKLADKGHTLSPAGAITLYPNDVVAEGPYTANKEFVSGFMIIQADSLEEAITLAKTNGIFRMGGSIEIRELVKR